jgi:hypothetical protein
MNSNLPDFNSSNAALRSLSFTAEFPLLLHQSADFDRPPPGLFAAQSRRNYNGAPGQVDRCNLIDCRLPDPVGITAKYHARDHQTELRLPVQGAVRIAKCS